MKNSDLAQLVQQKIENLQPKLLDLSRRNPLIATKLGPRSNSHVRAVDELPDIVFFKLNVKQFTESLDREVQKGDLRWGQSLTSISGCRHMG
jgi:hypothetical protein